MINGLKPAMTGEEIDQMGRPADEPVGRPLAGVPPWWYIGGMKRKTSISLSDDLLRLVAKAGGKGESRSETIERLVREGLLARARRLADERDLAILNRHADALNREAAAVLEYQSDL